MASPLPLILFALLFFSIGLGGTLLLQDSDPPQTTSPDEDSRGQRRTIHTRDSLSSFDFKNLDKVFELIPAIETSEECLRLARNLNADPDNRHNKTLWSLLLVRWSEIAPEEMINFLESEKKNGHPTNMEELAWEAWGISDPEKAAPHLRSINYHEQQALIKGIAQVDPSLALAVAKSSPATASLLYTLIANSPDLTLEKFEEIKKAGADNRYLFNFPESQVARIAENDPQAAFEIALRQRGSSPHQFPSLIGEIARVNPEAAKQFLAEQPTSRSKALATVEVSKRIAFQNPTQSLAYARALEPGLTRDASLISIASVIGGEDPLQGLSLIEEANWTALSSLHDINKGSSHRGVTTRFSLELRTPHLAARLLSNLAVTDLGQAEHYLETVVPEDQREEVRRLFHKP